ncbi:urease gamma subunit, partial [Streptacidiphilus sp. BW17]
MRLTPTEKDRLLLFTAAQLARSRQARGLRLNVPEATALIADTVCEAARDGRRLAEAIEA